MNLFRRQEESLSNAMFLDPPREYRGAPFWAWNCEIDRQVLDEQIEMFKRMGMGGFHIHVRTGMATPYLSDEFMDLVRHCLNKANECGLLTYLYDEDRWPSGTAGGLVTAGHPEYRAMNLLWTTKPYGEAGPVKDLGIMATGRGGNREENGELLGVYDVVLDEQGCLSHYQRISPASAAQGTKWYAYAEYAAPSAWFNHQAYIDTLNKDAVDAFVSTTHERYCQAVGDSFGTSIPAIFTDEPSFAIKGVLPFAADQQDVFLTWTASMESAFRREYHESLLEHLPELFWELPNGAVSLTRYRFHDLTCELFARSYADTLSAWCRSHGLALSGHLLHEETLESQTKVIGEAMRSYRAFTDIPGVDILCDRHEYNTLKQAQSAKHQQGTSAMLSELYGVSGWDYDFRGYKLQGDWQAALGVTLRVPHLTWMSMKGEAKRDFPACIGYQSPWWERFALIENHFARLNTVLTRGVPVVRVAVIHPIESYWLHWGPKEQTAAVREQLDRRFAELTETLLFGSISFDFISESRLPELCPDGGYPLKVGAMAYDTIIVPACETLRRTTLTRLMRFHEEGGQLIFLDECPKLIDAQPNHAAKALYQASTVIPFTPAAILTALEDVRDVDIRREDGGRTDHLLHQLRQEKDALWLFVAQGKNPPCPDVDTPERIRIRLKGEYHAMLYNTMTGEIFPFPVKCRGGYTELWHTLHMHDSLLFRLLPGQAAEPVSMKPEQHAVKTVQVPPLAGISLEEPNVMLLDTARWSLDGGPLEDETELLHLDNECRARLGLPRRAKHVCQPYMLAPEVPQHSLKLIFELANEVDGLDAELALEDAASTQITLNGQAIPSAVCGFYVDKAIERVKLPSLKKGANLLELTVPFGRRTNLEWCYLLGDFGIRVNGSVKTLTARPANVGYGSLVHQGYPFYTGNFTYHFSVLGHGQLRIRVPKYRAALMEVSVDGSPIGTIICAPYSVTTPVLENGTHTVEIRCFGLRQNGFGQVHHEPGVYFYQNSNSWRSDGDLWLDEYQLRPMGILKKPEISILDDTALQG